MAWKFYQLGYRFHFLVETQEAMHRIRIRETLHILEQMEDPRTYDNFVACNNDNWCVVKVKNSDLLIGLIIHGDDDPKEELRRSIELVDIINLKLFK